MILAGDIGGTNVRLALFELEGGRLVEQRRERFRTAEFRGLEEVLDRFAPERAAIGAAGFGIAGPVRDGRSATTNLPWVVEAGLVAHHLGLPRVALVNDLVANGLGLMELTPADFSVLNAGEADPEGNGALCSAGTGLGESILVREGTRFRPLPSEGGHASFAPRDDHEVKLLKAFQKRYGHVSYERIVSGPGLAVLYQFERELSGILEPAWLRDELARATDPAPVVSAAALAGRDQVAERALHLFVTIWGAEAGNLALKALATGGVFLGGGIAPRILPKLLEGSFFTAFCDKGRFAPMLARIPLKVVRNDACALLGAARSAAGL